MSINSDGFLPTDESSGEATTVDVQQEELPEGLQRSTRYLRWIGRDNENIMLLLSNQLTHFQREGRLVSENGSSGWYFVKLIYHDLQREIAPYDPSLDPMIPDEEVDSKFNMPEVYSMRDQAIKLAKEVYAYAASDGGYELSVRDIKNVELEYKISMRHWLFHKSADFVGWLLKRIEPNKRTRH